MIFVIKTALKESDKEDWIKKKISTCNLLKNVSIDDLKKKVFFYNK